MCYSLPTVENPFLDEKERAFRMTHGKKVNPEAPKAKRAKTAPEDSDVVKKKLDAKPAKLRKVFWPKGDAGKARIASSSDSRLPGVFQSAAESLGVSEPSGFQAEVWQAALRGQGVWGFSGGGGTEIEDTIAGYVLPAVQHLRAQEGGKSGQGPAVLVLVPTRARGMQVRWQDSRWPPLVVSHGLSALLVNLLRVIRSQPVEGHKESVWCNGKQPLWLTTIGSFTRI